MRFFWLCAKAIHAGTFILVKQNWKMKKQFFKFVTFRVLLFTFLNVFYRFRTYINKRVTTCMTYMNPVALGPNAISVVVVRWHSIA
jgi:hypothetical protein